MGIAKKRPYQNQGPLFFGEAQKGARSERGRARVSLENSHDNTIRSRFAQKGDGGEGSDVGRGVVLVNPRISTRLRKGNQVPMVNAIDRVACAGRIVSRPRLGSFAKVPRRAVENLGKPGEMMIEESVFVRRFN
jgi:hypothetical protein